MRPPTADQQRSLASSAIAPAVPQLMREFNSDNDQAGTLVVTIEVSYKNTNDDFGLADP